MNKEEAKARIEAAEKELAAAKAALEQAQETDGRVIMKPSEVPVGEYFKFVDDKYSSDVCLSCYNRQYLEVTRRARVLPISLHDDKPVYLTDPYGNAIEPCEKLPGNFFLESAIESLRSPRMLSGAFIWSSSKDGGDYWGRERNQASLSPSAAAKLRGMIHKWNQENGGQG